MEPVRGIKIEYRDGLWYAYLNGKRISKTRTGELDTFWVSKRGAAKAIQSYLKEPDSPVQFFVDGTELIKLYSRVVQW